MRAKTNTRWTNFGFQILAIVAALLFTTIVLLLAGAPPLQAYQQLIYGVVGSPKNFPSLENISNVIQSWIPLLITTAGLLVTFALIESVDHYKGAALPMALWALLAGLLYLVGPVLWVLRVLPEYGLSALLGIGLTVALLVPGAVSIRRILLKSDLKNTDAVPS